MVIANKPPNSVNSHLKVRVGAAGLHFFNRSTGVNLLVDEISLPSSMWSTAPHQVSIALTNACDLVCPHCYAPKNPATLNFEQLTNWLTDLDANGCIGVGFGGGEPTLYPRLAELCSYATEKTGLAVTMTTHAHHLSDRLLKELVGNVHFIRVSMDGVNTTYEYTFAGEIPWSETFSENGTCKFSFVVKEEHIQVERMEPRFFLDGRQLDLSHVDIVRLRLLGTNTQEDGKLKLSPEELERLETRETLVDVEEVQQDIITYHAFIPVCDFRWESSRSAANNVSHATTLAKEISSDLKLIGQPQTFDLVTSTGVKATCDVSDRSDDFNNSQSLFYMREELLRNFLKENDLALVWAVWGERQYSSNQVKKLFYGSDPPDPAYTVFSFIKCYE